jgi:GH25 family lysozyme M1 (1,4-beta-N-acetylmuramidase)
MIYGIDVSHHNGDVDWSAVASSNIKFSFLKSSEGINYIDPSFQKNLSGALGQGLVTGAYHFFHPNIDPARQASHFLSTFDNKLEILTALDLEWTGTPNEWDGIINEDICERVRDFLNYVKTYTGRFPIIYFSPSFFSQYLSSLYTGDLKTWVAKYGDTPPSNYDIWQYSEKGVIIGIDGNGVDLDRFEGTFEDLQTLAGVKI